MRPLILLTTDFEPHGVEFGDASLSLSRRYAEAVCEAGGLPVALPPTPYDRTLAEYVGRADGVLLTGGDDVRPNLYAPGVADGLWKLARLTPDGGLRDLCELLLLDEVFRQRKPLLCICRGHQVLNVALGGTLVVDLPAQRPSGVNHWRMDLPCGVAHFVRLTPGSLLAKMARRQTLGVNSTHHQAVERVAPGLRAVAVSPDGVVEALEQNPAELGLPFLLSVQWHPERLRGRHPAHRAVFAAFVAACGGQAQTKL